MVHIDSCSDRRLPKGCQVRAFGRREQVTVGKEEGDTVVDGL